MRNLCISIVATLVSAGTSFAATINVPGDYATIQGAIDASSHGDVIAIAAGTYNEHSIDTDGKAITIGSASGIDTIPETRLHCDERKGSDSQPERI